MSIFCPRRDSFPCSFSSCPAERAHNRGGCARQKGRRKASNYHSIAGRNHTRFRQGFTHSRGSRPKGRLHVLPCAPSIVACSHSALPSALPTSVVPSSAAAWSAHRSASPFWGIFYCSAVPGGCLSSTARDSHMRCQRRHLFVFLLDGGDHRLICEYFYVAGTLHSEHVMSSWVYSCLPHTF